MLIVRSDVSVTAMSTKDKAKYHGTYALAIGLPFVIMTFGAFGYRVKG